MPRRTLLRGALAGASVAIGLPLLEIFLNDTATAQADGSPLPKRFGFFFWGNGAIPDLWMPEGEGPDWTLPPLLAPLASLKKSITVVGGMEVRTGSSVPHGSGAVGILTGAPFVYVDTKPSTFAEPTIDQVIAQKIGSTTRFRSLEIGADKTDYSLSFNGPYSSNPQETSPLALFQRVFGEGFTPPGSTPSDDPTLALRRSVLDAVSDDARRLSARLGSADRARLDQHLTGIRQLEAQLDKLSTIPSPLVACAAPPPPAAQFPDVDGRPALREISRAMADILALALACDQTRVFSHVFSSPGSDLLYPVATAGHHPLTHDEPQPQPQVQAITQFIMGELAYFLGALAALKEGDGSLLDRCAVLCTTDCAHGLTHQLDPYPILIAGGAGGALKQGVYYRPAKTENASKVLLTLARAMGLPLDSYGKDTGRVVDSLGAIEA